MREKLSLLLVEDHASFREALEAVITMSDDLEVVADVDRAELAAEAASRHEPDVAIVDLDLPGADGVSALADIHEASPDTACVVLTALRDEVEMGRAIEAGAAAILHKSVDIEEILEAVRGAARGATLVSPHDAGRWLRAYREARDRMWHTTLVDRSLTPREKEILGLLAEGGRTETIAKQLGIRPSTVQTHIRNVMGKLDVPTRLEAVTTAIRLGIVDPPVGPVPGKGYAELP